MGTCENRLTLEIAVLAGGGGTRLWPLSDPARPKPFLPLLGDETLIQRTVARVAPIAAQSSVTIVADGRYADLIRDQLPGTRLLAEPVGRNTAAAVALAALSLTSPPDEVMAILPADHVIADEAAFVDVLRSAADRLATGAFGIASPLVTLGVKPDRAATEYGYLLPRLSDGTETDDFVAYPLEAFVEKPDEDRAVELLRRPGTAWNAGIFLWRRQAILEAFDRHAGDVTATLSAGLRRHRLVEAYEEVRAAPIDRAVMEPAAADGLVVMATADVGWSDLGSWTVLLGQLGARGSGRVVPPGERARVGADDLVVRRDAGRLVLDTGPRDILAEGPVAILVGTAPDRAIVEALISRTAAAEVPS
jgi:mannose-1-phosphate guanylyltransferase